MDKKKCSVCNEEKLLTEYYAQKREDKKKGKWIYYNPECKECTKARSRKRQLDNHDQYILYTRQYHKDNKLHEDEIRRSWREKNKERYQSYIYNYQNENKDKMKIYAQTRKVKIHEISQDEWLYCKEYFNNSCAYCGIELKIHLREYNQDLHKDHVDCNGSNGIENCVPACKNCNSRKWQYSLNEWFNESNPVFNIERIYKIHKWLNEDVKLIPNKL